MNSIPEAPDVWEDVMKNYKAARTLYKKKRRYYINLDRVLKIALAIAALSLGAFMVSFIRAYWVCGF